MIHFNEALSICLQQAFSTGKEKVSLVASLGRVLAEDIIADIDMPPFDKSAVDGYACKRSELQKELEVIDTIPAGKTSQRPVIAGSCMKIMTGAPIPQGADCVVMVENSLESGSKVRFDIDHTAPNICYKGEDVKAGQKLIESKTIIHPGHIAVMASAGYDTVTVARQPRVCILSTGDELVEPSEKPTASTIRNSNAYQLLAQCQSLNISATYAGIAKDNETHTRKMIEDALSAFDVVLLTGGVSMGDFDHVPSVMKDAGLEIRFRKIAIQPGRPTVFACKENKLCFGLPGNPVSSFVLFEMIVKPVLYKMMGHLYQPTIFKMRLGADYRRKRDDRMNVIPVIIVNGEEVHPVEYHGSAHIHAMTDAQALLSIESGIKEVLKGSIVDVRPL